MKHYLKCIPPYFDYILSGLKNFEYRKNDRDFHTNDLLYLEEYIVDETKSKKGIFSGRAVKARIKYILKNFPNLPKDYCILGLTDVLETTRTKPEDRYKTRD